MTTSPQLLAQNRRFPVLLVTGFAVGVVDIVYAFLFYGMFGATPTRILQGIASGILGRGAFADGSSSVMLGLALHFFIAYSVTTFYFLIAKRISWLNGHAIWSGMLYGAGVYLFMHYVVIPLSAYPQRRTLLLPAVCEFVEHMLFVGLPIALAARIENSNHLPMRAVGD